VTEDQYKKLCEACDHILLAQGSTVERVAIQWLHVISEHPALLDNYQGLFEAKSGLSLLLHKWFYSLRNLIVFGSGAFEGFTYKWAVLVRTARFLQNADIERFNRTARHEWLDLHLFGESVQNSVSG
jgi:hypothetical protein